MMMCVIYFTVYCLAFKPSFMFYTVIYDVQHEAMIHDVCLRVTLNLCMS